MRATSLFAICVAIGFLAFGIAGCVNRSGEEVVVYAALDREFSEPILREFEKETGIRVVAKYDVESTKTVGLTNELIQTRDRPRADVFWNNEILNTFRLENLGLLTPHRSPRADDYPIQFVSGTGMWHGFAARARVLIVNTDLLPDASERPDSVRDLADEKWRNNCGMAKPLFGTTATHASVLFARHSKLDVEEFFSAIRNNAIIESGNRQVARHVAEGRYAWGLTDTDDAIIEIENGRPVVIVYPDQADGIGALLIPNSLCLIKGGPNTENGRKLIDFLLRHTTEEKLAVGASAQIPLNRRARTRSRVQPEPPTEIRLMEVDFDAAANQWPGAMEALTSIFLVNREAPRE